MLTVGLFAVGIGWIVSSLHVFLRDTAQMLGVVLTFWFWGTPIFVDESHFPQSLRFLLQANPMYYAVRSYRTILLHNIVPAWQDLAISAAFGDFGVRGGWAVLPLYEAGLRRRALRIARERRA